MFEHVAVTVAPGCGVGVGVPVGVAVGVGAGVAVGVGATVGATVGVGVASRAVGTTVELQAARPTVAIVVPMRL
jgi:hypothetical protein